MNNYYSVVTKILEIAQKHQFIKEAHYGDIYEFHNSGNRKYMTFTLTQGENSSVNENYTQYNFTAFVTDRLTDDSSNLLEVQSNCSTVLNQIMLEIQDKLEYFMESQSISFWKEKFNDLCAGCFVTFSMQVPNDYICNDEDTFVKKTLTITSNGTYSTIGYDQAEVNVHSDDELSIFTLYPSNYFNTLVVPNANTTIEAKIQFTGDGDYIFAMDADGLTGIKYNEEENQTYAGFLNNNEDWVPLNLHKDFWQKGAYKVILSADKCQIGYYTYKLNENKVTGSFRNQIYIGYDGNETSSMEIYSVKISNEYGAVAEFVPKITEGKAKIVDSISGNDVEIRTVYSQKPVSEEADYIQINTAIPTGVIVKNPNYKTEIKVKYTAGTYNLITNANPAYYGIDSTIVAGNCNTVSNWTKIVKPTVGTEITFKMDYDKLYINDTVYSLTVGTNIPTTQLYINSSGLTKNLQLGYCKIWDENDNLIFDTHPYYIEVPNYGRIYILKDNVSGVILYQYVVSNSAQTLELENEEMMVVE